MSEQYRCKSCGYVLDMKDMMCSECGNGYFELLRWTKGGDGSHWEGCEEVHWDCKIAKLEAELEKRTAELHYANTVCMEMKHELDRLKEGNHALDQINRDIQTAAAHLDEVLADLARRDEIIARLKEYAERTASGHRALYRALMKELE